MEEDFRILQVSEDCIQIICQQKICPEINFWIKNMMDWIENLYYFGSKKEKTIYDLITETVPSYCALSVYFNPQSINTKKINELKEILKLAALETKNIPFEENQIKVHTIPVCYEDDFAPDIQNVCEHSGLSKKEVILKHTSQEYLIYMLGFLPGFPYLGGMSPELETPRLKTPRTKIPSGAVAIGGSQTGIYSVESPGGWQIIGQTPLKTFDPDRSPEVFFNAGDKIKFNPITKDEFFRISNESNSNSKSKNKAEKIQRYTCGGGIQIISGGMNTTVQDSGRIGFQKYGINQNGVMDKEAAALANLIAGNPKDSAVLECMLSGPEIFFTTDASFVITGATVTPSLNESPVPMYQKIFAPAGSTLKIGFVSQGLRFYIAFSGGILVPKVFNSCSTNLKCKFGGLNGRSLSPKDELPLGEAFPEKKSTIKKLHGRISKYKTRLNILDENKSLTLHCYKAAQYSDFPEEAVIHFITTTYTVTPESDRMGIRLSGEPIENLKSDIISDGIPLGSVQINSAGLPMIMASDRQTCGGYAKIATICHEDMNLLSQAQPGTKINFTFLEK